MSGRTTTEWIRLHIEHGLGMTRTTYQDCQQLVKDKRDPRFDELRANRLSMGVFRYESLGVMPAVDYLGRAEKMLALYRKNGNREYLVDAANYVELEWLYPWKEGTFFNSTDHEEA